MSSASMPLLRQSTAKLLSLASFLFLYQELPGASMVYFKYTLYRFAEYIVNSIHAQEWNTIDDYLHPFNHQSFTLVNLSALNSPLLAFFACHS
jgi:hypothetical protein